MTPPLPLLSVDEEQAGAGRHGEGQDEGRRPPGLPFNGPGKWGLGSAWFGSKLSSSGICICISPRSWLGWFLSWALSGPWPEARARLHCLTTDKVI